MAVYRRPDSPIWYTNIRVNGKRLRVSTGETDKREAEKAERALRRMAEEGTYVPQAGTKRGLAGALRRVHGMTLEAAFKLAWKEHWAGSKAYHTYALPMGNEVLRVVGAETPLVDIQEPQINAAVQQWKREGNSASTINSKLSVLRVVLRRAKKVWKEIDRLPDFEDLWQRDRTKRKYIFSPEEEALMLLTLQKSGKLYAADCADFFACLFDTGCRLSEVLTLCPQDVDWMAGTFTLWETKTNSPRTLPMSARMRAILEARSPVDRSDRYFQTLDKDKVERVWKWLRKTLGKEGTAGWVIHGIRHTFASRMLAATGDLRLVQEYLGHAQISQTQTYTHFHVERLITAQRLLEVQPAPVTERDQPAKLNADVDTSRAHLAEDAELPVSGALLPGAVFEWGSGGRRFKSSRPDQSEQTDSGDTSEET